MKMILFTIATVIFAGCSNGPECKAGIRYYPVKVCSIVDVTGESCVEYAAENYCNCDNNFRITTLEGHKYEFNKAGWSIILTKK